MIRGRQQLVNCSTCQSPGTAETQAVITTTELFTYFSVIIQYTESSI